MNEPKRIDIKEFRNEGFLQELNRQFLHPLGMALEVIIDDEGNEKLGGIWDYRDDPEGMLYQEGLIDKDKINRVEQLRKEKAGVRMERYGEEIQSR